jgi:Secretion system C-terminal sorting domain
MRIRLLLCLIATIVFTSNLLLSQIVTFDKDYYLHDKNSDGYIIEQTLDGDYIIGGKIGSNLLVAKINNNGELIFTKEIEQSNEYLDLRTFPVHITSDGGLILTTGIANNSITNIQISKLDSDGNTIWQKSYLDSLNLYGSEVIETQDGDFLAIGTKTNNIVEVIKTDQDGNLLWFKNIEFNPLIFLFTGPTISILSDGNYLAGNGAKLEKMSVYGDSLWRVDLGFKVTSVKTSSDGKIIAAGYRKYSKLDLDGNIEWVRDVNSTINCIHITNDEGYVYTTKNQVVKTDSLGAVLWEKDIISLGNYIMQTSDGGYVITGNYFDNMRVLKTDQGGDFKTIYIANPESFTQIPMFNSSTIKWYSNGIENIDIHYSIDGGLNWTEIIANYPSDSIKYDWYVPNTPSNNCQLKVSDALNSEVSHTLRKSFSIMRIQNYDYIAGNECKMWIGNNGMSSHYPITDDYGFLWPGGEQATIPAIFEDGIVWGGIHDGMIKVNGATYRYGLMPGTILDDGTQDDPAKSEYAIFKLKKDWQSLPSGDERDLLEYNYNNWPGEHGAPFNDLNGDGIFTKGVDEPEIIGDETLFYVANDLDSATTAFTYGSPPIGIEFQQTLFAYNTPELKDAVFKRIRLINKSNSQIDSMYIGYWADDDLGDAGDDYSGCDSLLSLAYTYNGDNDDEHFYGTNPPAVGRVLLQGAVVEGKPEDIAKYKGRQINGYRNLQLNSHYVIIKYTGSIYEDPELGTLRGTFQFYKILKGALWNGDPIIDPNTGDTTKLMLAGDPVKGTGWYDGDGWPDWLVPNDRRSIMSSGSFTMAPGDTQEVVYAIFMARGSDNIQSITELKKSARVLHEFWGNDIPTTVSRESELTPLRYSLSQNYPNPFNPTTTIKYQIPESTVMLNSFQHLNNSETPKQVRGDILNVKLIVYDILGREVVTLVNQKQKAGSYTITFDASKYTSGIYFYKLKTNDFVQTKKMMLLK